MFDQSLTPTVLSLLLYIIACIIYLMLYNFYYHDNENFSGMNYELNKSYDYDSNTDNAHDNFDGYNRNHDPEHDFNKVEKSDEMLLESVRDSNDVSNIYEKHSIDVIYQ
jgi:hypothetical protein